MSNALLPLRTGIHLAPSDASCARPFSADCTTAIFGSNFQARDHREFGCDYPVRSTFDTMVDRWRSRGFSELVLAKVVHENAEAYFASARLRAIGVSEPSLHSSVARLVKNVDYLRRRKILIASSQRLLELRSAISPARWTMMAAALSFSCSLSSAKAFTTPSSACFIILRSSGLNVFPSSDTAALT